MSNIINLIEDLSITKSWQGTKRDADRIDKAMDRLEQAEALADALEQYIQSIDPVILADEAIEAWGAVEKALKAWRE